MTTPTVGPRYRFAVGPWNTGPVIDLTRATGRQIQLRAAGEVSQVSFTVDGRSPEALQIEELVSDMWVYRDALDGNGPTLLTRCRVGGQPSDTIDEQKHTVTMSATDYRDRLNRLVMFSDDTLAFANKDGADIAWTVVSTAQGHVAANLGITRGLHPTTFNVTSQTFDVGTPVYQALETLAGLSAGFDWDVDPLTLALNIWTPYRGRNLTDVYSFGDNITQVTRTWDTTTYGNAVLTTGGNDPTDGFPLTAVSTTASDLSSRPEGRYELITAHPEIIVQSALAQASVYDLAAGEVPSPAYTCRLKAGVWSPQTLWLGDLVFLVVNSGRLSVMDWFRVQEIDINLSDIGQETVDVTFGIGTTVSRPDMRRRLKALGRRLSLLERIA